MQPTVIRYNNVLCFMIFNETLRYTSGAGIYSHVLELFVHREVKIENYDNKSEALTTTATTGRIGESNFGRFFAVFFLGFCSSR